MSQDKLDPTSFSPDIHLFLSLLHEHGVRHVIVGGEAVIFYGYARLTGDIDIFYKESSQRAKDLDDLAYLRRARDGS